MKRKLIKTISTVALILIMFPVFSTVYAQEAQYTLLVPLPGVGGNGGQTTLSQYLPGAFNLTVGIAVALAFVFITFGGVLYATSDALTGKSQGREYIQNALWGLLLVIGAYTLLYTINPQILDFQLDLRRTNVQATPAVVTPLPCCTYTNGVLNGYTLTPAQQIENTNIRNSLLQGGVQVNNGPCTTGGTSGCTNVVGLPATAQDRLRSLKNLCDNEIDTSCVVVITGGTEGGHRTHGPNLPRVDLRATPTLNAYLGTINVRASNPYSGLTVNLPGGGTASYEVEGDYGRSSGAHWHVQY